MQFNLLTDNVFPTKDINGTIRNVSLCNILSSDEYASIEAKHEDMSFFGTALLIHLAQWLFCPKSDSELKDRFENPLDYDFANDVIKKHSDAFNLIDDKKPFLQYLNTKDSKSNRTNIQSLFLQYASDTGDTLYSVSNAIECACPACVTLALILRSNTSFYGAGYKNSFYKKQPHFIIGNSNLRKEIWMNVVPEKLLESVFPEKHDCFFWEEQDNWFRNYDNDIKQKETTNIFSFQKGYFNIGAKVLFEFQEEDCVCDYCGEKTSIVCKTFLKEKPQKGSYDVSHVQHPNLLGARKWIVKKKEKTLLPITIKNNISEEGNFWRGLGFLPNIFWNDKSGTFERPLPFRNNNHLKFSKTRSNGTVLLKIGNYPFPQEAKTGSHYFENLSLSEKLLQNRANLEVFSSYFKLIGDIFFLFQKSIKSAFGVNVKHNFNESMFFETSAKIKDKMFGIAEKEDLDDEKIGKDLVFWMQKLFTDQYDKYTKTLITRDPESLVLSRKSFINLENDIIRNWIKERWG